MPHSYATDHPIIEGKEDLLNRAPFAERVADVLASVSDGDNLVVGIHGPWGDGKTSVLNMIRKRLSESPSVVFRDFNPWRLSSEEKIIRRFIIMLASALGQSLETKAEKRWKIFKKAKPLGELAQKIPGYGDLVSVVMKGLEKLEKSGDDIELEELRNRLETVLKGASKKVIILIDDIDRLDSDEIHILFKLIKACTNLPNVSYLLAFDEIAVANTLNKRYSGPTENEAGRAFLEKIIQIPLKLPYAQPSDVRLMCLQDVQNVLNETNTALTSNEVTKFLTYFDRSCLHKLKNPRAGKRYVNLLRFSLPMLKGEVNTVDLLLIEAIRSFFPEVYDIIKENQALFHGVEGGRSGVSESLAIKCLKKYMDSQTESDQERLQAILAELFPRLAPGYLRGGIRSGEWLTSYAKEKRICSPEYCPRYFSYTIPRFDVADSLIDEIISSAGNGEDQTVSTLIETCMEPSRARKFISKLRLIEEDVDSGCVELIAVAITSRAFLLPNTNGFMNFDSPPMQAGILISHLIQRLEDMDERYLLAEKLINVANPLWFAMELLRWLNVTDDPDDPDKEDKNALSGDQVELLKNTLVARIKASSDSGAPLFDPEISQEAYLLTEWAMKEGRDVVQRHLQSVFEKDTSQVLRFLESMGSKSWSVDNGLPSPPEITAEHLKRIESFFDLEILAQIVMGTCRGNFANPSRYPDSNKPGTDRIAEQFIYAFKKWKESKEKAELEATPHGLDPQVDET
jgi:hypothetical protein